MSMACILVEAFTDDGAGSHANSDHFAEALEDVRPALVRTPAIISRQTEGSAWDEMAELKSTEAPAGYCSPPSPG